MAGLGDALVRQRLVRISGRAGEVTDAGLERCRSEDIDFSVARAADDAEGTGVLRPARRQGSLLTMGKHRPAM